MNDCGVRKLLLGKGNFAAACEPAGGLSRPGFGMVRFGRQLPAQAWFGVAAGVGAQDGGLPERMQD